MDNMDIDSPSETGTLSGFDVRIVARLSQIGVPKECLYKFQSGLVDFVRNNESWIPRLASAILPSDDEILELQQRSEGGSRKAAGKLSLTQRLRTSMLWLQWLMFRDKPSNVLNYLSEMNVGGHGVCGAVWGNNDIAYRCRTCEHDPTCAICVPCFENGNHEGHDYSTIYTGGGCCDCGDVTAWKREGFCSKHKGAEQIKPLPPEIAKSAQPVLDVLLSCWRDKLLRLAESNSEGKHKANNDTMTNAANELTFTVVNMFLEFCKHSESLLSFVSIRLFTCNGLLDILLGTQRILDDLIVKKLNELLLKLLAEPSFKYEFAKAFLSYYPTIINAAVKEGSDDAFKDYSAISTFAVQILTVPTLTPCLVKEMKLLVMLFRCLREIFVSTAGEDGRLQVTKWQGLYDTTIRVLEDVRFVMNHAVVPKYILCSEQDSLLNWMDLLAFIQGMNPQKRETGPAEEEIENNHLPFALCISIARVHSLLVEGAFSDAHFEETSDYWLNTSLNKSVDVDSLRYAKVGRFSQENSAHGSKVMITASDYRPKVPDNDSTSDFKLRIPAHVVWLIHECLRATENWLLADNTLGAPSIMLSQSSSFVSTSNYSAFKRLLKTRTGRYISSRLKSSLEVEQSKTKDDDATMASEEGTNLGGKVKLMLTDEYHSFSGSIAISKSGSTGEYEHVPELERMHLLGLSEWPNITYDVSSQDISVHIPLHRLLSLLLRNTLKYSYGESTVPISQSPSTSSFDFFEQILGKFHQLGFSAFIMEHPLRIRVFVAEVHAGMWRKNGETALLSCEWYRSVQWSEQGLDLDLFMMQFCAALAPPDLYVRRILERFGLLNYLSPSPSRANEYEPILVQEMLTFLIQIVKERRFCGHSTAESLRRELIYKLTTGDFTRSQLVKSLPHDLAKFSRLQEVLDIVASYSNPSGHKQGKYSLRSPYWKELDLYHPHWNLRDLQLSEERYVRFCNESPLTAQLPRWTSIYEPMARVSGVATCRMTLEIIRAVLFHAVLNDKPSESRAPDTVLILALHFLSLSLDVCFQMRASNPISFNIGDSLPILALAIEVVDDGLACGFGEMSLLSVLVMLKKLHKRDGGSVLDVGSCDLSSLIESILKNFAELDSRCMAKLQKLAPELVNNVAQSPSNIHAASSRLLSDDEKRKAKARERQAAIMAKMRAEQSKFLACMDSSNKDLSSVQGISQPVAKGDSTLESAQDTCSLCHDSTSKSPLSFLIHLQKSKLASLVDKGPLSWERVEQPDKYHIPFVDRKEYDHCGMAPVASAPKEISNSRLGQFVQNAVSKFAYYGLPGEVNALLEFFKAQFPSLRNVHMPCISKEKKESTENKFLSLEENMFLSAMEFLHSNRQFIGSVEEINFSAKQDLQGELSNAENILFGKYIACLSQERAESPHASKNLFSEEAMEGSAVNQSSFDGFSPVDCDGIFLSSCGHVVHQECLDLYLSSLKERYIRRIVFEGGHIVDLDQGEFLCPVCRRLANSILPAVPSASQLAWKQFLCSSLNFSQSPLIARSDITCLYIPQALCQLQSVAEMVKKGEIFKAFSFQSNAGLNTRLESFISVLSNMYFRRKQEKLLRSTRTNRSVIMWDTLRYSIISTEISARSGRTSLEPKVSLHALYEELISSGKFILPLFLEVIQSTRTENALDVLQRLRGIKLFADSICIGISSDYPNNPNEQQGNIFWILKDAEKEMSYVDTLFWKRSADPVLAHDPFSSLMWVLFCLPFPFLFSGESFLSLVHIFYAVSVAQIIVTYAGKYGFEQAELDSSSCLISAICKLMSESKCLGKCFISNYMDYSSNVRGTIRSFTFPYLRRCALLWNVVNSSTRGSFSGMDFQSDMSFKDKDDMDGSNDVLEHKEIQELEKMFKIPSVDNILEDANFGHLVQRWLCHFIKEFEHRRFNWIVHCTPAAPFKLMELPRLYQNLLLRYVKQRCVDCNSVLVGPALCLLCGRLCSPSWKPCCRENGCQNHATVCGAGTGVFLLIRRTTILLQRSSRQAPWPSPYLDAFGEEDVELARGKPLYLNEERYAALSYMVASHGIDRSSSVLRQATLGAFVL
ncbi:hypothetical protein SAY87_026816 [Trapa incisa]|uniref:E3 ubiquitin-protein ligase n=1 Tax=Trapa incisa TaxID=236973 RepID=A0AAN7H479_9MYRT|nr:hypothetical protein SAY87_026816 [Trapa incisa]